ncbi:VTC domain-containing protein [Chloroflexota bacterium]
MVTDIISPASFRHEKKFIVSHLSRYEIESIVKLHPAMFSEIYYQRFVNNIYFDTVNMSNYISNLSGISHRLKARIRWYGELFGLIEKPVLELKIKKGFLGSKVRFPLESFCLDNNYLQEVQQDIFAKAKVPDILAEYLKLLRFTLLNRYSRRYFESADKKFRITIDFGMEAFRIDPISNSFIEIIVDRNNTILELKYSEESDEEAGFTTNCLPFRMTKSSKYATGIESIYPLRF